MKALDSTAQEAKVEFVQLVTAKDLFDAEAVVSIAALPAEKAIGHPST